MAMAMSKQAWNVFLNILSLDYVYSNGYSGFYWIKCRWCAMGFDVAVDLTI